MATQRAYCCFKCNTSQKADSLFDALLSLANNQSVACPKCHSIMTLQLTFPFGLGVGNYTGNVEAVFVPSSSIVTWKDPANNDSVTFYPFLVVISQNDDQSIWLPYWHVVKSAKGKINNKYGQWAPFLDIEIFNDLVGQAKRRGYQV